MRRIDWISFTVPMLVEEGRASYTLPNLIAASVQGIDPELPELLGMYDTVEPRKGRAPYSHSWSLMDGGVTIFGSVMVNHALVEISGKGLTALYGKDCVERVLELVADRLSRLDIARDIWTEDRPIEFAAQRVEGRFSSRSEVVSNSGETVYIGSKHSDLYARVYRYNPPHPRSEYLRIEYCIRAEQARIFAAAVLEHGLDATEASLGDRFGWLSPVYAIGSTEPIDITLWRPERREGKTVSWLYGQVAAAILKLHKAGILDARVWFYDAVLSTLDEGLTGDYNPRIDGTD